MDYIYGVERDSATERVYIPGPNGRKARLVDLKSHLMSHDDFDDVLKEAPDAIHLFKNPYLHYAWMIA